MNAHSPAVEFRQVTKRFQNVLANSDISFRLETGTIHGVVGENGAGKSTIMKILYGMYQPDEGQILVHGSPVQFRSPLDAIASGIGMVHQHFMLVPTLPVWQNIVLGKEPAGWLLNAQTALKELEPLRDSFGFGVDLLALAGDLPVGQQQQVEILKLLYRQAQVLILDEPTAVLTPQEVEQLGVRLKKLKDQGKTIAFISHKLKEILHFTDNVTVLRQGKVVDTEPTRQLSETALAEKMVGRQLIALPNRKPVDLAQPARLVVRDLSVTVQNKKALDSVSFEVRPGEILGVAGVDGNGQAELVRVLLNVLTDYSGDVTLDGTTMRVQPTYALKQQGLSVVPSDRLKEAVIADLSVKENYILGHHWESEFVSGYRLDRKKIEGAVTSALEKFDVRPRNPNWPVSGLSGGNQQKLVLARELARPVRLLVASQPTRGVDIGAIEYIHSEFIQWRDRGAAVVVVSTELDEILQLADRILVLYEGRVQGQCLRKDATETTLGLWMTGARPQVTT